MAARGTNGRDVVMGLVVTTGRIGATTGRLVFYPARAVARSPLGGPFRGRADSLAATGRNAELDARRRLETVAGGALATPEAEQVIDGVFAGALPEAVARSLVDHRVVERIVAEALERAELERKSEAALETERTEQLVEQVLTSPSLERMLVDALESRLTLELTDTVVHSEAFKRALTNVLSSPEVRRALAGQSRSFAGEIAAGLRARMVRVDDAVERRCRRWVGRHPRPEILSSDGRAMPFAGIATRGVGLAADAVLLTLIFLVGTGLLGLVVSLVWKPRPASAVEAFLAVAWVLLEVTYFTWFWSTVGQTPGMRLMRVRVADAGGSAPGPWRSLLRLVGLALAILLLFLGFVPVLFDDRRRALQDYLAGTVVIVSDDA
jgi:uncharacterized RDD family membrane protein YckC/polyhydroxyalkanoate synthesis regulator phasin